MYQLSIFSYEGCLLNFQVVPAVLRQRDRLFSKARQIVTLQRGQLKPEKANMSGVSCRKCIIINCFFRKLEMKHFKFIMLRLFQSMGQYCVNVHDCYL